MRCREAKQWLAAQRDNDSAELDTLAPLDISALQEHLKQCPVCRAFEQHQRHLDALLHPSAPRVRTTRVSTDQILLAVQQQRRISQQLEDIRKQQQCRVERLRPVGAGVAAIVFFTLGSVPLLLLAVLIVQTDLVVKALSLLTTVIDVIFVLAQYLQAGLTLVTHNNWLLSIVAFAVVVMMGMWLRLMRHPQGA